MWRACLRVRSRVASQDFEWHGKTIRRGEVVYLWSQARIVTPACLPLRMNSRSVATDQGVAGFRPRHPPLHRFTLLAKLQLGEFFPAMFERFVVEVLDDPLDYSGGYAFRTLSSLTIRVQPVSRPPVRRLGAVAAPVCARSTMGKLEGKVAIVTGADAESAAE